MVEDSDSDNDDVPDLIVIHFRETFNDYRSVKL